MKEMGFYICCIIYKSRQAGHMSLWRQHLSLLVGFCHVIIHLPQTAFLCQAEHLSLGRHLISKNIGSVCHFPPWRQVVAKAAFSQKNIGFVCHFPLWRQIVARATDLLFLFLFMFLSFVQVLITSFQHKMG